MKKNKMSEKEYKKKHLFAMDDDYEDDYDDDEIDDDEDADDDDEDDGNDDIDDEDDSDEDDEDDEDDDDEDDDNDDDDDRYNDEDVKRARRRSRRIRNQILAYIAVLLLIGGAVGGIFLGSRKIVQKIQADKREKQQEELLAALGQEEEPVVEIEDPAGDEVQVEEPALSPLDEIVTARIAEMPLDDKVAALFMVTPEQLTGVERVTKAGNTTKEALTKYKVGGLVYTESNISDADQLKELLSNTALIDQTLFLAVSEEGGENSVVATVLSGEEVPDMASIADAESARQAGESTGTYLAEYGFNLNLAPVADVKTQEDSVLGNRSFGSDAAQVGEKAAAYIQGLTGKGVSACVKMFPGLGGVTESTAEGMADTKRSQADMESTEFLAYQAAINAGSEFVMVGTMSAPALTNDNTPCCLSQSVIGLLRDNLGYDGIVITGDLSEASVKDYNTSAEAAEKALRAGADMIYMPENFEDAYSGLLEAARADEALQSRIDEALLRIYRVKYKGRDLSVTGEDTVGAEDTEETGEETPGAGEETPAE